MSKEKLKLWNGRLSGFRHGYIAAYSRADAVRVYEEFFMGRGTLPEIRDFWSEGQWGNTMIGVTPRRGMFAETKDGALVEFIGFYAKHKPLERDDSAAWEQFQAKQKAATEAAEREREQAREEKRERIQQLSNELSAFYRKVGDDYIEIDFKLRKYRITEVED